MWRSVFERKEQRIYQKAGERPEADFFVGPSKGMSRFMPLPVFELLDL